MSNIKTTEVNFTSIGKSYWDEMVIIMKNIILIDI